MKEELPQGCIYTLEKQDGRWIVGLRGFNPAFWRRLEIPDDEAEEFLRKRDELVDELHRVKDRIHEMDTEFMRSVWERME